METLFKIETTNLSPGVCLLQLFFVICILKRTNPGSFSANFGVQHHCNVNIRR